MAVDFQYVRLIQLVLCCLLQSGDPMILSVAQCLTMLRVHGSADLTPKGYDKTAKNRDDPP